VNLSSSPLCLNQLALIKHVKPVKRTGKGEEQLKQKEILCFFLKFMPFVWVTEIPLRNKGSHSGLTLAPCPSPGPALRPRSGPGQGAGLGARSGWGPDKQRDVTFEM